MPDQKYVKKAFDNHKIAKLTLASHFQLFFVNNFEKLTRCKTKSKVLKFYHQGRKRVNDSLDIIKVLKDIKYLKVLNQVKHNPYPEFKFKIYHNRKNIIEI